MRFVFVLMLGISVTACAWETLDSSYGTAKAAVDAGMIEKGWIPAWVPQDATDLREVHNVDSNVSELSFAKPTTRPVRLPTDCRQVAHADVFPPWIGRDWWPDDDVLARSYTFFQCQADHTEYRFVAISKAGDRVLHWRTYAR